tara:strand:- start:510 stop:1169 length:660 start_codon:yes stop_codon:yes gene_type:complete
MIISIHQPAYLPWLGYFDKIINSDVFIYLDNTQFQKGSFQNRNYIRTKKDKCLLTVPVLSKKENDFINLQELKINNKIKWQNKHFKSIIQNYRKAKNYNKIIQEIEGFYTKNFDYLNEYCWQMLNYFLKKLNIKTTIVKASSITKFDTKKSDLIFDICNYFDADIYLTGTLGYNYLNTDKFEKRGISIKKQLFIHPTYNQVFSGFEEKMGIIDYLFNTD